MGTNLITSKNENNLERTLHSLIEMREENKDLLYQFSLFISNSPDYKYNSTYLSDEIDFFLESRKIFDSKVRFFKKLIKDFKILNSKQKDIKIIFDDVFEFNLMTVNEKTYDFDNLYFKEFKFNCIGTKKIVVEFICKKIIRSYEIKDFTSDKSVLEINMKFELLLDNTN